MYPVEKLHQLAKAAENDSKTFFKKLNEKQKKNLDQTVHALHDKVFKKIDCLTCANCCKTLSPIITDKDIEKLAKRFRKKPSEIVAMHLKIDEEGDYVFTTAPCPFLLNDNYCMVYEDRPKACREYPHTNRKRFYQLIPLTIKNTHTCPAGYEIMELLKTAYTPKV